MGCEPKGARIPRLVSRQIDQSNCLVRNAFQIEQRFDNVAGLTISGARCKICFPGAAQEKQSQAESRGFKPSSVVSYPQIAHAKREQRKLPPAPVRPNRVPL